MKKDKWVWMPHSGHFICGRDCRFHLNTYVGNYIVSTVGEYEPDMSAREILAQSRGIKLEGIGDGRRQDAINKMGFEELGLWRTYETMVFKAYKDPIPGNGCCPYVASDWSNLDMDGYQDARAAYLGHNKMCLKWSKK